MLTIKYLKTFATKTLLAVLYSSAFYLSFQLQMPAMYQLQSAEHRPVFQQQSINILPFQEQETRQFAKQVSLLPVIVLPVSGLFNSLVPRIAPISSIFPNHIFENTHSPISLEIAYRNLRI